MAKPLLLTDVVLRDAHQSLLATRFRLDDMLPVAAALDDIGYWSLESWGGATFDACIRYLGEDPWVRIRELKKAMPKTKQQMLLPKPCTFDIYTNKVAVGIFTRQFYRIFTSTTT